MVGYTFYNLLYDVRRAAASSRYNQIAVNERFAQDRIGIYFVDPDNDPDGLLKRYDVYSARSFPSVGVIIVNVGFIKDILNLKPYIDNLTGESFPQSEAGATHHMGDQIILKLEKSVEGVKPWTFAEYYNIQALFICVYVVIHEVGRIHDYDILGKQKLLQEGSKIARRIRGSIFCYGLRRVGQC